jgi:hypothetical protein
LSIPFNKLPCSEPGIGSSRSIAGLTMEEMFGFAGDLDLDLKIKINNFMYIHALYYYQAHFWL